MAGRQRAIATWSNASCTDIAESTCDAPCQPQLHEPCERIRPLRTTAIPLAPSGAALRRHPFGRRAATPRRLISCRLESRSGLGRPTAATFNMVAKASRGVPHLGDERHIVRLRPGRAPQRQQRTGVSPYRRRAVGWPSVPAQVSHPGATMGPRCRRYIGHSDSVRPAHPVLNTTNDPVRDVQATADS